MERAFRFTDKKVLFFCLAVLLICSHAISIASEGSRIRALDAKATQIFKEFLEASLSRRAAIEYGEGLDSDRGFVHVLASETIGRLDEIEKLQRGLKKQIEAYTGDDWDERYGESGLWRKLNGQLYKTRFFKCKSIFYEALCAPKERRKEIVRELLNELKLLEEHCRAVEIRFLKAQGLSLLWQSEQGYCGEAKELLGSVLQDKQAEESLKIRARLYLIKLSGAGAAPQLRQVVGELAEAGLQEDLEVILAVGCLQRSCDEKAAFRRTVEEFHYTGSYFGDLILSELVDRKKVSESSLQQLSSFEAELAAEAAWRRGAEKHSGLLQEFLRYDKFRTPVIYYVTAQSVADAEPRNAVRLLIKAAGMPQQYKNNRFRPEPELIAAQAAELAYNVFLRQEGDCDLSLSAFERYRELSGDHSDPELDYMFSVVLRGCGEHKRAVELLAAMVRDSNNPYFYQATLDLIRSKLSDAIEAWQRQDALYDLERFVEQCASAERRSLRLEALELYCMVSLESGKDGQVKKILQLVQPQSDSPGSLQLCRVKALRRLGRLEESAKFLLRIIDAGDEEYLFEAMNLLRETFERIDTYFLQRGEYRENDILRVCVKLARICRDSLRGHLRLLAGVYLAEGQIIFAASGPDALADAERFLDGLDKPGGVFECDILRCRARLFARRCEFEQAAELWGRIEAVRTLPGPSDSKTWQWWRAKYYQLACLSRIEGSDKKRIKHSVDVLQRSFDDIAPFWEANLESLKEKL